MALEGGSRQLSGISLSYEELEVSNTDQTLNRTAHSAPTLPSEFLKSHGELQSYRYELLLRVFIVRVWLTV